MIHGHESKKWLSAIPTSVGWYLAGFADGEGSFNLSLRKRNDHKIEWQACATFNVAQRDITNLLMFKKYLECGRIQKRIDGVNYFVVTNYECLLHRVLPFFEKFEMQSLSKKHNFMLFKEAVQIMNQQAHLNAKGLRSFVEIREQINEGHGRTRKYSLCDVYPLHSENPQRLDVRV